MNFEDVPQNNKPENQAEDQEPSYEQIENVVKKLAENGTISEEYLKAFQEEYEGDVEMAIENLYSMLLENGIDPDEFMKENVY